MASRRRLNQSIDDVLMKSINDEDENELILEADFDLDDPDDETSSAMNTSQTSANQDTNSEEPRTEDQTLLNETHSDLDSTLGDVGTADELNLLLDSSPEKTSMRRQSKRRTLSRTDTEEGAIKILVPITIAGGCVKIKFDDESKKRIYCNDYYERSIEMTKDKSLWKKIENDDFREDEERPDLLEYTLPSNDEMICLYQSLNLYENKLAHPTMENVNPRFRLDSVLIRGVTGMSTNDVFLYLRTYQQIPMKLEWVNDHQCIAVFGSVFEAARCLIELTKPIIDPGDEEQPPPTSSIDTSFDLLDEVPKNWVQLPMPPSHVWRFTVASFHDAKSKPGFLFTIPRVSDKKQAHAESLSDYYREYGNPNWNGNETPSIWTKSGYDAKMLKKRHSIQLKKAAVGQIRASTSDPDREEPSINIRVHLPITSRLGIPNKRKRDEDQDDAQEETSTDDRPVKMSRRVTLAPLPDEGVHQTGGSRWKDGGERSRPWDGYEGRMVADEEDAGAARRRHLQGRQNYGNRGGSYHRPRGSIRDRLGW